MSLILSCYIDQTYQGHSCTGHMPGYVMNLQYISITMLCIDMNARGRINE